ncbi:MAG TPA: FmdB family zinc ribbon protein [Solirubrobacteraceae bacterium]|jgi:putative FmdB family regulatory protein
MPIYEYRCDQGHTFEAMQRMSDDPLVTCESCEAPVQRVFRPVAVHFKGSGFYNTDYGTRKRAREKEAHKSAEGSGGDSKSSDSKSEKKSDSKPKPDSKAAAKSD